MKAKLTCDRLDIWPMGMCHYTVSVCNFAVILPI